MDTIRISCDDCAMRHSDVCADCLVSHVCSRDAGDAVVLDLEAHRAMRRLMAAGLVPEVRHRRREGTGGGD